MYDVESHMSIPLYHLKLKTYNQITYDGHGCMLTHKCGCCFSMVTIQEGYTQPYIVDVSVFFLILQKNSLAI